MYVRVCLCVFAVHVRPAASFCSKALQVGIGMTQLFGYQKVGRHLYNTVINDCRRVVVYENWRVVSHLALHCESCHVWLSRSVFIIVCCTVRVI